MQMQAEYKQYLRRAYTAKTNTEATMAYYMHLRTEHGTGRQALAGYQAREYPEVAELSCESLRALITPDNGNRHNAQQSFLENTSARADTPSHRR